MRRGWYNDATATLERYGEFYRDGDGNLCWREWNAKGEQTDDRPIVAAERPVAEAMETEEAYRAARAARSEIIERKAVEDPDWITMRVSEGSITPEEAKLAQVAGWTPPERARRR